MTDGLKDKHRKTITDLLSANPRVKKVVLFGSRATGTFTVESDVDIALFGEKLTLDDLTQLSVALEETSIPQMVDLVHFESIENEDLRREILTKGVEWGGQLDWPEVSLGEVAKLLTGYPFKSTHYTNDPLDPKVLGGDNIVQGSLRWDRVRRWPRAMLQGLNDYWLAPGDVVLAMDRPWIVAGLKRAAVGQNDLPALLVQRTARLRGSDKLDTGFLRYLVSGRSFMNYLVGIQTGTAIPHISPTQIKAFSFPLPPLPEQRRIAAILGALDDKIELNRQMNRNLEEMAQVLFKSWFVDFDPVLDNALRAGNPIPEELAEKAERRRRVLKEKEPVLAQQATGFPDGFVKSELGWIPRGWGVGAITELIMFNPRTSLKKGEEAPFADMKALPTDGMSVQNVIQKVFKSGGAKFLQGDTLLARITPCLENGKTALVDFLEEEQVGFGSTEFIVMRPAGAYRREWVYCLARSDRFRQHAIANMTGSSGRQRVPATCFDHFPMPEPDDGSLTRFADTAAPLFDRVTANSQEIQTLSTLRDTLLPKLISGEIRVPEVEEAVEEPL
jgi:type I restriction enzyme S subunit